MIPISFDQSFQEAVDYFKSKGIVQSANGWRDLWQEAHSRAFTTAKLTDMDLMKSIKDEVTKAIDEGLTLTDFQGSLKDKIEGKGWLGEGQIASRLQTIFRTNSSVAYNVGRYQQQMEVVDTSPFWQYMGITDARTRRNHQLNFGKVYPYDHPFWRTHYPPLGFNCRCYVRSLSARNLKSMGLSVETQMPIDGKGNVVMPDEGWAYNPGKAAFGDVKPVESFIPKPIKTIPKPTEGIPDFRDVKPVEVIPKPKEVAEKTAVKTPDVIKAEFWKGNEALSAVRADSSEFEKLFKQTNKYHKEMTDYLDKLPEHKMAAERKSLVRRIFTGSDEKLEKYMDGISHIKNDKMLDLIRHDLKITWVDDIVNAKGNPGRSSYSSKDRLIQLWGDAETGVGSHETAHAFDDVMSNYGKSKSVTGYGYWDSPYASKSDAQKYKEMFKKNIKGGKGKYHNGDGEYWRGSWVDDYDSRIYGDMESGFGEQFFAMNSQRYAEYTRIKDKPRRILIETAKKMNSKVVLEQKGRESIIEAADKKINEFKNLKRELSVSENTELKAWRDYKYWSELASKAEASGEVVHYNILAGRITKWTDAKEVYNEFPAFLEKFYKGGI